MKVEKADAIRFYDDPDNWIFDRLVATVGKLPDEDQGKLYWGKPNDFYVQRGLRHIFGHIKGIIENTLSVPAEINFKGTLRGYQQNEIPKIAAAKEGIIIMPTASGKTIMMIALAAVLKEKTLIVTHTNTLLNQTKERVKEFSGIDAGQIGNGVWNIDKPITVGLIQTIEKRIDELADKFGLIEVDETAHVSADTWFRSIAKFKARFRYGFSADIRRSDKKEFLIEAILGKTLVKIEANGLARDGYLSIPDVIQYRTNFFIDKTHFCQARCYKRGDCPLSVNECTYVKNGFWAYMLGKMTKDEDRNALIVKVIEKHIGKYNLVLSDRIKHLEWLKDQFWTNTYLVVGKMPVAERDQVLKQFMNEGGVLLATTGLLGEGYDLPAIDRLFLTCPAGGRIIVGQRLGRIMRPKEGEKKIVIDFTDWRSELGRGLWFSRRKIYSSLGCKISTGYI